MLDHRCSHRANLRRHQWRVHVIDPSFLVFGSACWSCPTCKHIAKRWNNLRSTACAYLSRRSCCSLWWGRNSVGLIWDCSHRGHSPTGHCNRRYRGCMRWSYIVDRRSCPQLVTFGTLDCRISCSECQAPMCHNQLECTWARPSAS